MAFPYGTKYMSELIHAMSQTCKKYKNYLGMISLSFGSEAVQVTPELIYCYCAVIVFRSPTTVALS